MELRKKNEPLELDPSNIARLFRIAANTNELIKLLLDRQPYGDYMRSIIIDLYELDLDDEEGEYDTIIDDLEDTHWTRAEFRSFEIFLWEEFNPEYKAAWEDDDDDDNEEAEPAQTTEQQ